MTGGIPESQHPAELEDAEAGPVQTVPLAGGPPSGFGQAVNEYLNNHVFIADTKATLLLGADLAIAGALLTNQPAGFWPLAINWISVLALLGSVMLGGAAVFPRLFVGVGGHHGLIFWEDVAARKTPEEYVRALTSLDVRGVERAFAHQNFHISNVLKRKYRMLRWCTALFLVGITCAVASVFAGKLYQGGKQPTASPPPAALQKP